MCQITVLPTQLLTLPILQVTLPLGHQWPEMERWVR